jgi:hypothetical protein
MGGALVRAYDIFRTLLGVMPKGRGEYSVRCRDDGFDDARIAAAKARRARRRDRNLRTVAAGGWS